MGAIIGRNPVIEALKAKKEIETLYISSGNLEGSIKKIMAMAKDQRIVIKSVDRKKLTELSEGENHQGVVAIVNDYKYYDLEDLIQIPKQKNEPAFFIILDGITDPHNLGAIVRSAEALGAHGIIISKRRSALVNATVYKTSAGAVEKMPIARVSNLSNAVKTLQKEGVWIYSTDMEGRNIYEQDLKSDMAIIIGNEGEGVSRLLKENSDFIITIPMNGSINSLNASVATGIILYEVSKQRHAI